MGQKKKAAPGANRPASDNAFVSANRTPPKPSGQCAKVFNEVKKRPGIFSLVLTADMAIPEAAARIHDLRCMGFNIITTIHPTVVFRGVERRNVASYHLGSPAWPRPGFLDRSSDPDQHAVVLSAGWE